MKQNKGKIIRDEKHPDRPVVEVDVQRLWVGRGQNVDDKGKVTARGLTLLNRAMPKYDVYDGYIE